MPLGRDHSHQDTKHIKGSWRSGCKAKTIQCTILFKPHQRLWVFWTDTYGFSMIFLSFCRIFSNFGILNRYVLTYRSHLETNQMGIVGNFLLPNQSYQIMLWSILYTYIFTHHTAHIPHSPSIFDVFSPHFPIFKRRKRNEESISRLQMLAFEAQAIGRVA